MVTGKQPDYSRSLRRLVYQCLRPDLSLRPSSRSLLSKAQHLRDQYVEKHHPSTRKRHRPPKVYFNAKETNKLSLGNANFSVDCEGEWDEADFRRLRNTFYSDPKSHSTDLRSESGMRSMKKNHQMITIHWIIVSRIGNASGRLSAPRTAIRRRQRVRSFDESSEANPVLRKKFEELDACSLADFRYKADQSA